jgi:hypothetical protein
MTGVGHVKFGMEIDYRDAYTLCMIYCLSVNNYKHGDDGKLWGYPTNFTWTESVCNKFFTKIKPSQIILSFVVVVATTVY